MEDKPVIPQPIAQMRITIMDDGGVNINGFPNNLAGDLDENNKIIEKKIITPNEKLVDGAGRPWLSLFPPRPVKNEN